MRKGISPGQRKIQEGTLCNNALHAERKREETERNMTGEGTS
jgi:hypothetical protein